MPTNVPAEYPVLVPGAENGLRRAKTLTKPFWNPVMIPKVGCLDHCDGPGCAGLWSV